MFVGLSFLFPIVFFGFLICSQIYVQIISKKNAGRVLLDIGPLDLKWILLVVVCGGILIILFDLYHTLVSGLESWQYAGYFSTLFSGIFPYAYLLIIVYSRLQVRENGIWLHLGIIKWERIESFFWEPENKKTWFLTLRYPGRLPTFLRERILFIPAAKKDEFAAILEQYSSKMSLKGER